MDRVGVRTTRWRYTVLDVEFRREFPPLRGSPLDCRLCRLPWLRLGSIEVPLPAESRRDRTLSTWERRRTRIGLCTRGAGETCPLGGSAASRSCRACRRFSAVVSVSAGGDTGSASGDCGVLAGISSGLSLIHI